MSAAILNILLKVVALLIALLIWFNVMTQKQYDYELNLPITGIDTPPGLGLVNDIPATLTAKVRADGKKLLRSDWKEAGLRIKGQRLKRGLNALDLNLETVALVRSDHVALAELRGITSIPVFLDRIDSVEVPIASRLEITPAAGYALVGSKIQFFPPNARLIGPAAALDDIDTIYTESRALSGIRDTVSLTVALDRPPRPSVMLALDSIRMTAPVEKSGIKRFENVRLTVAGGAGRRMTLMPEKIVIDIEGPVSIIDTLSSGFLRAVVTPPAYGEYVRPEVALSPDLRVHQMIPDSIHLLIPQ